MKEGTAEENKNENEANITKLYMIGKKYNGERYINSLNFFLSNLKAPFFKGKKSKLFFLSPTMVPSKIEV